jgi:hypothetical protein
MRFSTLPGRVPALFAALLSCASLDGKALAAPPTAAVGWTRIAPPVALAGASTRVTEIVTGPSVWGYRIKGNVRAPRIDRLVIELDVPCNPPKSTGGATVTPTTGPSRQYVLTYAVPSKNRTVSITCDTADGGNASFTMMALLGGTKILARSATATVNGPGE